MKLIGTPDTRPAHLTLDADRVRYRFDGFGGNYCFGIESPVTQYTLDHLKVAWARTEMSLALWEPENDNESPDAVSWEAFERRDTPDSRLRREWLLMKQIQDKGIPYVISAWRMPQWLTEPAGRGSRVANSSAPARDVARDAGGRRLVPALCERALRRRAEPFLLQRGEHRRRSPPLARGTSSNDQTPWCPFEETGPEDKDASRRYRQCPGHPYLLSAGGERPRGDAVRRRCRFSLLGRSQPGGLPSLVRPGGSPEAAAAWTPSWAWTRAPTATAPTTPSSTRRAR